MELHYEVLHKSSQGSSKVTKRSFLLDRWHGLREGVCLKVRQRTATLDSCNKEHTQRQRIFFRRSETRFVRDLPAEGLRTPQLSLAVFLTDKRNFQALYHRKSQI